MSDRTLKHCLDEARLNHECIGEAVERLNIVLWSTEAKLSSMDRCRLELARDDNRLVLNALSRQIALLAALVDGDDPEVADETFATPMRAAE